MTKLLAVYPSITQIPGDKYIGFENCGTLKFVLKGVERVKTASMDCGGKNYIILGCGVQIIPALTEGKM